VALSNGLKMAGHLAEQLRWAEINEAWAYMEAMLKLIREMGGRVLRAEDPRFRWRSDYIVSFNAGETLPLLK
jgi:hypothetical protein